MSEDWPGTLAQQVAVREAFKVEFGSPQHKLLQKVDRRVNAGARHYLPIAFAYTGGQLAFAGASGIVLSELLTPAAAGWVVQHEFGHTYEQLDLVTQDDRTWFMGQMSATDLDWRHHSETFADAFRDWWRGVGWVQMTSRLLRGVGDE